MKVAELSGAALDWAVCKARGEHQHPYDEYTPTWMANRRYSEDWAKGGPIIEREMISIEWTGEDWMAYVWHDEEFFASSPLIAAMRCYVAHKLGEEIEVPEELMEV